MLKINVSFKGIEEKLSKKYEKNCATSMHAQCTHSSYIFFPNLEHCVGGGGGRVAVGAC